MANPTFGEKKRIQTILLAMAYMQLSLILNKNKLFLFKNQMELGFTAEIGTYYGQADEYFYSRHRDTYYYNPAYLYEATSFKEVQKPLEDFNHITWFPIDEAIQNLKRGSHKWAIESWKK